MKGTCLALLIVAMLSCPARAQMGITADDGTTLLTGDDDSTILETDSDVWVLQIVPATPANSPYMTQGACTAAAKSKRPIIGKAFICVPGNKVK